MTKRIVSFIHTSPAAVGPLMQFYTEAAPELQITNLLDDDLLRLLAAQDAATAEARLTDMVRVAATFPPTLVPTRRLIDEAAGECRAVLRARHPWTLYEANRRMDVYNATFDWHTVEGAFVRRHGGRYYLFYSGSNWQSTNYGVDYAVADRVNGPYTGQGAQARVLKGVPGKVRGPGHHSIVTGPDGKTEYFVYHAWDAAMKVRQLCIDRLVWTPQGPRLAAGGPTYTPQPRPALR